MAEGQGGPNDSKEEVKMGSTQRKKIKWKAILFVDGL